MLLKLEDVKLSLGGRPILKGVSLEIGAGEIYGLLGPNGAGKSTTIAAALGLLKVSAGTVRLFDHDPAAPGGEVVRTHVGVMPEQNGLYEWMTAEDYLTFFAGLYQVAILPNRFVEHLQQVGLEADTGRPISTYSRGMKQRLALARALLNRPQLLVLDEPTNGLDPRGRRDIHDIFLHLATEGTSILLCTHLLDDVERLCTRVGFIDDGRTIAEGRLADLLAKQGEGHRFLLRLSAPPPERINNVPLPFHVVENDGDVMSKGDNFVLVDVAPATSPEAAWREAFFLGWPIIEIQHVGGGLEDLYLSLTSTNHELDRSAA